MALALLIGFGILLIQAATPAVAMKHGLNSYHFVKRHLIILGPAVLIMFSVSLLRPRHLRLLSVVLFVGCLVLLAVTPFLGSEIKGAVRWLQLFGLSLQPSEFMKPVLAVIAAWLFARQAEKKGFPALSVNVALYGLVVGLLLMQPDIGMVVLVSAIWFGQFFLAGLPLAFVGVLVLLALSGMVAAYFFFPHFASRMDRFLTSSGDTYQIDRALDAFVNGGLFGTGPGAGTVKMTIPDAHADFVFAVAGEELGFIWCLVIIALYFFIIWRGVLRAQNESNLFILLAIGGLLIAFGLQAAINLASTLHLIPTKGMTLPFISYGGSSLLALGLEMGMLLALTRKRYSAADE